MFASTKTPAHHLVQRAIDSMFRMLKYVLLPDASLHFVSRTLPIDWRPRVGVLCFTHGQPTLSLTTVCTRTHLGPAGCMGWLDNAL